MTHIQYIFFILLFIFAAVNSFWLYRRIRRDHFSKIVVKAFASKLYPLTGEKFFSTRILQKTVNFLLQENNKDSRKALAFLCYGRIDLARKYFLAKGEKFLLDGLEAYVSPATAIRLFEKMAKENPKDMNTIAELASLYFIHNMKDKASLCLDRIDEKKAGKYARAVKFYYQALFSLNNGDMLSASDMASKSGRLFDKEKAYIEEAKTYILMGTIYRVCMVEDVAQFMFSTALDIYKKMGIMDGVADVLGNLGMLMVQQSRFEEATDYFNNALEANQNIKRESGIIEILNQKGLVHLLKKEYAEALKIFNDVLDKCGTADNELSKAFCESLIATLKYQQSLWDETIEFSLRAMEFYKNAPDASPYLECMYLQALALFEKKDFKKAKDILRDIIKTDGDRPSCFHAANAYSLLGLIDLRLKQYKSARSLFQQSLSLEHKNDRFSCIATDYANLSLIEMRLGDNDQSRHNWEAAMEYAKLQGNDTLYEEIKSLHN